VKESLFILANTEKSLFGIGDYIRLMSVINNLNFKKIYWLSNEILLPIARDTKFFFKVDNIKYLKKYDLKNSFVINCYKCGINVNGNYFLGNLFKNKKINDKINTEKFITKLMNFFNVKNYKIFSSKEKYLYRKNKILFGWHAPAKWKNKEMPMRKWKMLEKKLKKNYEISIEYQSHNKGLMQLISQIKSSEFVITIVSLVAHLSALYNKKTILLSGPTMFSEYKKINNLKLIRPTQKLTCKKCIINKKISNCICMNNIDINEIIKNLKINFNAIRINRIK